MSSLTPTSFGDDPRDARRFLSRDDCADLAKRIFALASGGGETTIRIASDWAGDVRWGRNRPTHASDRRENSVTIARAIRGAIGRVSTNQTSDAALRDAVRAAERILGNFSEEPEDISIPVQSFTYPNTHVWSDVTYAQLPANRAEVAHLLTASAEQQGMLSAGYIAVAATGTAYLDSAGRSVYAPQTLAECSLTVRDPKGTGSGWAGGSSYDWTRFDPKQLADIALQKCLSSRNPVAVEPGRYTVILEPQAAHAWSSTLVSSMDRNSAEENGVHPFFAKSEAVTSGTNSVVLGMSKLGQRVVDDRITISHDPTDPALGVVPFASADDPFRAVTWVDRGVLVNLGYSRANYAIPKLQENNGLPNSFSYRMSGGQTSVDEMIATTKRGLLVTRFFGFTLLDLRSLLFTGVTRDGLWLIENGKISKPVKNFRFTESPLFVFNNVEQLGTPTPVYSPGTPAIVPPMKVRDFSFTSLTDAV